MCLNVPEHSSLFSLSVQFPLRASSAFTCIFFLNQHVTCAGESVLLPTSYSYAPHSQHTVAFGAGSRPLRPARQGGAATARQTP